jgi:hypothetical protein
MNRLYPLTLFYFFLSQYFPASAQEVQISDYDSTDVEVDVPADPYNYQETELVDPVYEEVKDMEEEVPFLVEEDVDPYASKKPKREFPEKFKTHPYIRYQAQVNDPRQAEAYPWISADGLRMYFVKGNSLFFSDRGSRYDDFGTPSEVSYEFKGSITSCWLTNDELSLYTTGTTGAPRVIRKFSRASTEDQFRFEMDMRLDKDISSFVSSISFTPDGKTALLYNNPNSDPGSHLVLLDVHDDGLMTVRHRFYHSEGRVAVGQLSKDGKNAYFSIELSEYHKIIYKVAVNQMELRNPKLTKVLELKGLRIGKPSLTYDETYMVFNAAAEDLWDNNEIMVVDLNNLSYIERDTSLFDLGEPDDGWTIYPPLSKLVPDQVQKELRERIDAPKPREESLPGAEDFNLNIEKIYPNPTKGLINIDYHIPVNAEIAQVIVNDLSGREIYRRKIDPRSQHHTLDLKELGAMEGIYLVFVHTELGTSVGSKIYYQPGQ